MVTGEALPPTSQDIGPQPRGDSAPLSHEQERLWFLEQLAPESAAYNSFRAMRIIGPLDAAALKRSLTTICERHEALRTVFPVVNGLPVQRTLPAKTVDLPLRDLGADPGAGTQAERDAALTELLVREVRRPFNLLHGPPLRALLVRLGVNDHVLLISVHHIVFDGWSAGILQRELMTLYDAFTVSEPASLPDLPIQYCDYAVWQREHDGDDERARHLAYWKDQFADGVRGLQLPTDRPRPAIQTFRGARRGALLPRRLLDQLKALARRERATLFMTLLTAFHVLLYRYTGDADHVVGVPVARRTRVATESLIGCFINTLPLRADLTGDPSFRELLARVRGRTLAAFAHPELPFEQLVAALDRDRDLSRTPLFQVMFQLRNMPETGLRARSLVVEELELDPGIARCDLTLEAREKPDGLACTCEYNTDIFDVEIIERVLGHYQNLLEAIVADADARISRLALLKPSERRRALVEWNATQRPYPRKIPIHRLFEDQAQRSPDAVALIDGDRRLSYSELDHSADCLARRLRALGVKRGELVGVCMDRCLEFVVGALAIVKAGGVYAPLDPSHPQARLAFMLEDTRARVVLTVAEEGDDIIRAIDASVSVVRVAAGESLDGGDISETLDTDVGGDDLAYVIYTSGSTGKPKGVAIPHRAINRLVVNTDYAQLTADDVVAFASNCSFDAVTFEVWGALLNGARLVMVPRDILLTPEALAAFLRAHGVTTLFLTTALFNQMAMETPSAFGALRHLLFGGEAVDPRRVRAVLEHGAPKRLLHVYGPTESTTFATWQLVEHVSPDATTVPIGRPIGNTQVYVLDEDRQPAPIGVPGELYIGGDGLAHGYLHQPELTADVFISDPFSSDSEARLYRTGDLVRQRPDGSIEFLGRMDGQVKIRGFRIELGEIEAILGRHPAIQQVVVTVNDEGEKRLVAYIVPREGWTLSAQTLRQELASLLPAYMLPAAIVSLSSLPVNANGKVDRRALPPPTWTHVSDVGASASTATEAALLQIWTDLLGHPRMGAHDNFFELGGHSLLATRVVSRIRDTFGVDIPLRAIFEANTVALLATRIDQERLARARPEGAPVTVAERPGELPLSFTQERFWLLDQLKPGNAAFNIPMAVRMIGNLNVSALERSLSEIVRRQESLRTTFDLVNGVPAQRVHPPEPLSLSILDLRVIPEQARDAKAHAHMDAEFSQPFDLARGPLLRAGLLRFGQDDHMLLLTLHHSIFDGWSMGVFNRELAVLYAAFSREEPSPLPNLGVQYADYAIWQRAQARQRTLTGQLEYWVGQLQGAPTLLQLPVDRPRRAVQAFCGGRYMFHLHRNLTDALRQLGRDEGATLYMTLLAAFQTMLLRYTAQEDLVVGTPIAGRTQVEIEEMIGCFLNTLVLRTDLSGDPSFRELLGRTRAVTLAAYAHQEVPFEQILETLNPSRDASFSPLVQVMFILQNAPMGALELAGLTLQPIEVNNGTTKYDLTLEVVERPDGLQASLQYDVDLFDESTIVRMADHYQNLLSAIVADCDRRLSQLPMLTAGEERQIFVEWTATEDTYADDLTLIAQFEAQVDRTPNAVAFIHDDEIVTYHELNERANQLAWYLRGLGVGPEILVGVCLGRSISLVVALLGIYKAGGAYLPLDPGYPLDRLAYMLEDARAAFLLTERRHTWLFAADTPQAICLDQVSDLIGQEPRQNLGESAGAASHLAYVLYTSGSTGKPKGAAVEHRQLLNRLAWMWKTYPFVAGEVGCQKTSINFVDSLWELFGPLLRGVPSVILPDEVLRDAPAFLNVLAAHGVTRLWVVPSFLRALLEAYPDLQRRVPDLTFWATGGEPLSPELYRLFCACLPECKLVNIYGASEFFDATWYECGEASASLPTIPMGRPISNMRAYVLDSRQEAVPIGVPGELYIAGDGLAREYIHHPELTAERFNMRQIGAKAEERLYRTGDLARWRPDGYLEYLGRRDHQVKIRGFRVEPAEIEKVLAAHANVREGIVVVREKARGEHELLAYAVLRRPLAIDAASRDVRSFLEGHLPAHMLPTELIILEAFPLTPSGKVDRARLPAPVRGKRRNGVAPAAPQTAEERELVAIWEQTLKRQPIGIDDDFFELGGHSLLAVRLFGEIERAFGASLPLTTLLRAPTVRRLAEAVAGHRETGIARSLIAIQEKGSKPPLFCVHPLGGGALGYTSLARHLGAEYSVYGLQARGFDGKGDPDTSIEEMAAHYLSEIRATQPYGPYYLCGLSAGGVIAFEIAQQLERVGEHVALLAMFDSHPVNIKRGPEWRRVDPRALLQLAADLAYYVVDFIAVTSPEQRSRALRRFISAVQSRFTGGMVETSGKPDKRIGALLFESWVQERISELPEHIARCAAAHALALKRYVPGRYSGKVTVFRARIQRPFSPHLSDLGWGALAQDVETHRVPGNHVSLVYEPHVRVLAVRIKDCMARAHATPSDGEWKSANSPDSAMILGARAGQLAMRRYRTTRGATTRKAKSTQARWVLRRVGITILGIVVTGLGAILLGRAYRRRTDG